MDIFGNPDEVEAAAAKAGASMRLVCATAGIAHTTWYRWKNAETKPTVDVLVKLRGAIDRLSDGR